MERVPGIWKVLRRGSGGRADRQDSEGQKLAVHSPTGQQIFKKTEITYLFNSLFENVRFGRPRSSGDPA